MKLLDLFCGAGGAARGYYSAGFDVIVGVDIEPQPNYPYEFIQGDALEVEFAGFDLIHASPPCQRFSTASGKSNRREIYPDLLRPIRNKLIDSGIPYVIENVEGAPLVRPIRLCGTLFPKLRVLRHRLFELWQDSVVPQPFLQCSNHPPVYSYKKSNMNPYRDYVTVAGGGNCPREAAESAMDIDWMSYRELAQAIPPAYTSYIGKFVLTYLS